MYYGLYDLSSVPNPPSAAWTFNLSHNVLFLQLLINMQTVTSTAQSFHLLALNILTLPHLTPPNISYRIVSYRIVVALKYCNSMNHCSHAHNGSTTHIYTSSSLCLIVINNLQLLYSDRYTYNIMPWGRCVLGWFQNQDPG